MTLLSGGDAGRIAEIARIELPDHLMAELDGRKLGRNLADAIAQSKQSKARLKKVENTKAWEFWKLGDRDRAVIDSLKSQHELQEAVTQISAYNVWLSQKVLATEEVLKGQNDRIECAQEEIKDKMAEADATLLRFQKDVITVRDGLLDYLREAKAERASLASSSAEAHRLFVKYQAQAQTIEKHIQYLADLDNAVKAGFEQASRDLDKHAEAASNAVREQAHMVAALERKMTDEREGITEQFTRNHQAFEKVATWSKHFANSTKAHLLLVQSEQRENWDALAAALAEAQERNSLLLDNMRRQMCWYVSAAIGVGLTASLIVWAALRQHA